MGYWDYLERLYEFELDAIDDKEIEPEFIGLDVNNNEVFDTDNFVEYQSRFLLTDNMGLDDIEMLLFGTRLDDESSEAYWTEARKKAPIEELIAERERCTAR